MTLDPDHNPGVLSPEDCEKMHRILIERSEGSYGVTALNGILTASEVGPARIPVNWILEAVLTPPESDLVGYKDFPDFEWVTEKIEEWIRRIRRVLDQDPQRLSLLVYMPNLKASDITTETWANGFSAGMAYHQKKWAPLLHSVAGFRAVAPILMTSDPDDWVAKNVYNPFAALTPLYLSETFQLAVLAIFAFWFSHDPNPAPIRTSANPARNDLCPCGSGKKVKRCG